MMDYSEYKLPTCAGDGNQMGGVSPLDLPWEHVWFEGILRHLSLRDLFVLRATCQDAFHLVQEYFKYMFVLDLSSVGEKFGQTAFLAVTRDVENLRQLVLKNTKDWLTDSAVIPVIRDNLQLRRVDLTGCNNISNLTLQVLASHCPLLQDLCLSGCHWVSREGITAVGMQCRQLEKLNLTGCWDICDDTIITLVMVCRNLTFLSLGNIYGLTDESVTAIARSCCQLQQLNLRGCWRVTDRAVRILAEYCSSLKGLHVRECRNISERSLSIMRSRKVKLDVPPKFDQNRRALIKLNLQI